MTQCGQTRRTAVVYQKLAGSFKPKIGRSYDVSQICELTYRKFARKLLAVLRLVPQQEFGLEGANNEAKMAGGGVAAILAFFWGRTPKKSRLFAQPVHPAADALAARSGSPFTRREELRSYRASGKT